MRLGGLGINRYLNRLTVLSETKLKEKVDEVMNTYYTKRPYRSLGKLGPAESEEILKEIAMEKTNGNGNIYCCKSEKQD